MARAEKRALALRARFCARLAALYPEKADEILQAQAMPRGIALLVLPWRAELAEAQAQLRQDGVPNEVLATQPPILFVPAHARASAVRHRLCEEGVCYAMDAASLAVVMALAPTPADRVLDACAAPGGKTLALAAMMQGKGEIVAVERAKARFFKLRAVLARTRAPNVKAHMGDVRRLVPRLGAFSCVLVDAPCSTEARINPEDAQAFRYWSERKIAECARRQKSILAAAVKALADGGRLVYATCSHAPEENEAVLAWLLTRAPELSLAPASNPLALPTQPGLCEALGHRYPALVQQAMRILPSARNGAMFLALLRKSRAASR